MQLGCTKTDISRWEYHPCSTHLISKNVKLAVVEKASLLFGLTFKESENLSNKAGLSLCKRKNGLKEVCEHYSGTYRELLRRAVVSERMFQYYIAGKEPTKQALLAIGISLDLSFDKLEELLQTYAYCMSKSLPNDAIVMWFLTNEKQYNNNAYLLHAINQVLNELELPLLMTKPIKGY